jgi:hypothetical protein
MRHPAALPPDELLRQCETRRTRRSGPGGQHRNKVETAVVLTHAPTGVQAEANERRSQAENLRMALFRLRLNVALEVRHADAAFPSELWQARCRGGRIAVSREHDDFPAILAEALDAIAACADDPRQAAERLGCTSSQLIKLLKDEPRALAAVNARRRAAGLHDLK